MSLPLRAVRAGAAFLGGSSTLLTELLLPASVRGSSSYRITLGLLQSFLIERLAGMQGPSQLPLRGRFLQRKALGNVLELAGLATVRFSPLWVFAIAADAAGGGAVFVERLVEHLKRHGVLPPESHPRELIDVLAALQTAGEASASAVDLPPLSRPELEAFVAEMRGHYARVFDDSAALLRQFESIWRQALDLSSRQKVPLERILGVMALEAAGVARKGAGSVAALGGASWSILDESLLASYRNTLDRIAVEGITGYVRNHYRPFIGAAKAHFDPRKLTRVERWLGIHQGETETK